VQKELEAGGIVEIVSFTTKIVQGAPVNSSWFPMLRPSRDWPCVVLEWVERHGSMLI
jgi:hypothetical protein